VAEDYISEKTLDEAKNVLRADYWRAVRDLADDLKQAIKDGEITDREELGDRLHESIDGSHWIIYTYANLQVLCWTSNDDAYQEITDEIDGSKGASHVYQTVAFWAMMADVREQLGDEDDLFADEEDEEEDEEEEEEEEETAE
jgi:hypothetical protein